MISLRGASLVMAVLVLGATPTMSIDTQVVSRHFTPREQQTERFHYVPFDVSAGTTRLAISYRYDRADGANVIDLGLFEPGPLALGSTAFRGWSGGERTTVFVGADQATPGYWPGPLTPGRWHILLGLYKISSAGVDVEMTIETASDPVPDRGRSLAARPGEPVRRGPKWFAGALHAHTNHSDGALTPQQLADKARAEKLDFLAITDHNNTAHQTAPIDAPGLLVLVGEEVTTPGGHFNVWGLGGWRDYIDFRIQPGDPAIRDVTASARSRGALVSINHPDAGCAACRWTHQVPDDVHAIEIWNRSYSPESLRQTIAMWDVLLRGGRRLTAIAASDWHDGTDPLGTPSVRVFANELSTRAVLSGIRDGRLVAMADGATPPPVLTLQTGTTAATVGDRVRVRADDPLHLAVDASASAFTGARVELYWNGELVADDTVRVAKSVTFERYANASGYLRVHVIGTNGVPLAITNPIFIDLERQR
jgi:PHP domain